MSISPSFSQARTSRNSLEGLPDRAAATVTQTIALIGNPNAGKTTLFNALTGLRSKTSNFPGTTVEHRQAVFSVGGVRSLLIDLPGLYSLDAITPEEKVARDALLGKVPGIPEPTCILVVVDATNLERNLFLAGQVLDLKRPTVIALNMMDAVKREGIRIDVASLEEQLGCPVVPVSARSEEGMDRLEEALGGMLEAPSTPRVSSTLHACGSCGGCQYAARYNWAEKVVDRCGTRDKQARGRTTEAIDHILTHPVIGVVAFFSVMLLTFILIFWIAQFPMEWIDTFFVLSGSLISRVVPDGLLQSLLVDGVLGGVGGMLVFLPQICILFFVLSILEDTGYLARAAFVMDRLMQRVGLPGKAFVPLLSAHACAVPAIMSTRVIEDERDRLATILIAPLMSCSARVPVYAMVIAMLFPHSPVKAAMLFTGAYILGIVAGLVMALVFKKTLLKGETKPLVIELPSYRLPSIQSALLMTLDRALIFVRKAGTVILGISVILWVLATFPRMEYGDLAAADLGRLDAFRTERDFLRVQASGMEAAEKVQEAEGLRAQALKVTQEEERFMQKKGLEFSFAGMLGKAIEPVLRPLGFDWKISVGIISSFAAREVIVSTLSVLYGVGETGEDSGESLHNALRASTWENGDPVFSWPASLSLLVFYVLAMQCLPTQAVTLRETGSWKWPLFQFGYMSVLAYGTAWVTFQVASIFVTV